MKKEMLINVLQPEECRIAIIEDGVLEELYVERTSHESYVGNIYKGRIVNIEPSIQAAFVDFGVGRNGFLHVSDVEPAYYRHLETRRDRGEGGHRERDRERGEGRTSRAQRRRPPRERAEGGHRERDRDRGHGDARRGGGGGSGGGRRDRDRDRGDRRPWPRSGPLHAWRSAAGGTGGDRTAIERRRTDGPRSADRAAGRDVGFGARADGAGRGASGAAGPRSLARRRPRREEPAEGGAQRERSQHAAGGRGTAPSRSRWTPPSVAPRKAPRDHRPSSATKTCSSRAPNRSPGVRSQEPGARSRGAASREAPPEPVAEPRRTRSRAPSWGEVPAEEPAAAVKLVADFEDNRLRRAESLSEDARDDRGRVRRPPPATSEGGGRGRRLRDGRDSGCRSSTRTRSRCRAASATTGRGRGR